MPATRWLGLQAALWPPRYGREWQGTSAGSYLQDALIWQGGRIVYPQDDDQHACRVYDVLVIWMPHQGLGGVTCMAISLRLP